MTDGRTGRLPARVYRRRRLVVALLGLALVAVAVWGASSLVGRIRDAPPGESAPPAPTTAPATTAAPDASEAPVGSEPASAYPDCAPPTLTVTIQADAEDVPADTAATFTVAITNGGNADCVVDAGEAYREVVIVSGSDRVWSSKDCVPADAPSRTLLLAAGTTDTTQLAWNRERSAPGCPGGQPTPQPGTYQATVSLAGTSGGPVVFRLG